MLVRFYAVGRELAGVDEAQLEVSTVAELAEALGHAYGPRMDQLLAASTLLRDGVRHRSTDTVTLAPSDIVDLLPPFAGG